MEERYPDERGVFLTLADDLNRALHDAGFDVVERETGIDYDQLQRINEHTRRPYRARGDGPPMTVAEALADIERHLPGLRYLEEREAEEQDRVTPNYLTGILRDGMHYEHIVIGPGMKLIGSLRYEGRMVKAAEYPFYELAPDDQP